MMTPQNKARDMVSKFIHLARQTTGANGTIHNSKQCALIAVDEIINVCSQVEPWLGLEYYQQVKTEIEKL